MPQDTTIAFSVNDQYYIATGTPGYLDSLKASLYQQELHRKETADQPEQKQQYPFLLVMAIITAMVIFFYKLNFWLEPFILRFQQKFGRLLEMEIAPPVEEADEEEAASVAGAEESPSAPLIYKGSELAFSDEEIIRVLEKYFVYYNQLAQEEKGLFIYRLRQFMQQKNFIIHDESGFKEMPILISASAIQISFGLRNFLLPHFTNIHIYPDAFIGYLPRVRLLEGNVSGNTVNLSWQHFLDGYKMPDNGQNVGLHEFAHAYYCQYFETGRHIEKEFVDAFPSFNKYAAVAFEQEQQPGNDLYSDYALTNFEEFWAESVELFFEKPLALKNRYPELYDAIRLVLNQDPACAASGLT